MNENKTTETEYFSRLPIAQAAFPAPFPSVLEFNAPAHGTWNIVHMGMLVPESHQIYVCAANCMRGVVLTAAEMNMIHRFSSVILTEKDLEDGTIEETTVQGIIDILHRLPKLPPMVMVFTVCLHHFAGCSQKVIYDRLEEAFPMVDFVRCTMDPIMRKHHSPDEKLRKSMLDVLEPLPVKKGVVTLLGSDFLIGDDGDLQRWLADRGLELRQLPACSTYEDYKKLAEAECFISVYPNAKYGAGLLAKRLRRKHLYLPSCFSYEEILDQRSRLEAFLQENAAGYREKDPKEDIVEIADGIAECERLLGQAKGLIGETAIAIDYTLHPRPLGLARWLLSHGFRVKEVYLDAVNGEEEQDFYWLQEHAPELMLSATVHPDCRLRSREGHGKVLALGQKAAWFTGTKHFVNVVEGAGWQGFAGMQAMIKEMMEAFRQEKDPEDLIPRKGLGCESCI